MAKPEIWAWTHGQWDDMVASEAELDAMGGGPYRFHGGRSRGSRGTMDPGKAYLEELVGTVNNPAGNYPEAAPIIKQDDLDCFNDTDGPNGRRRLSMEMNTTHTGFQPGTTYRYNLPICWGDILKGYWDQAMVQKLGESAFRSVVTSGTTGHLFEIVRSEANIKQGMAEAQPSAPTKRLSQTDPDMYAEFQLLVRYLIDFWEGRITGASGLVNPYPIPEGVITWGISLGEQQFRQGGATKYATRWADGLQDIITILGADGYAGNTSESSLEVIFEPARALANSMGFVFGIYETGTTINTGTFKGDFYRTGFPWLAQFPKSEFNHCVWTSKDGNGGGHRWDATADSLQGFHDGWQAYLDAPDPDPAAAPAGFRGGIGSWAGR